MDPLDFRCEKLCPKLLPQLEDYMRRSAPPNNRSPKELKLSLLNDRDGVLFVLLDREDKIRATSGVLRRNLGDQAFAKIYFRFHIEKGVPHSIIDRYFEPATFKWCRENKLNNIYITVNVGHERTLAWVAARLGIHGCYQYPNPYDPTSADIRDQFRPCLDLIFDSYTWQYAFYRTESGRFDHAFDTKPVGPGILKLLAREFPHHFVRTS